MPRSALLLLALAACGGKSSGDSAPPPPAPVLVKALDISVYSGTITAAHVDQWKAAGFTHVIVGCQNATVAKQQLAVLVAGGMTVDLYKYLYFTASMTSQVQASLAIGAGFPVGRLWLDLEADPGTLDVYDLCTLIQEAVDAAGPTPVGIYTGSFWRTYMQGCAEFADLPLWTAHYDGVPTFDDWTSRWFGGWSMPAGKQYLGDTTVGGNGVDVDTNILWLNLAAAPSPAGVPAVPTSLAPNGTTETATPVTLTWSGAGATKYQLLLERGSPGAWSYSWTWTPSTPTLAVSPQYHGVTYRYRVRGQNAAGWGAWSAWAQFTVP